MELITFFGLYICKDYDPYGDNLFKSVYQLNIAQNGKLYMQIVEGPIIGITLEISYDDLEKNYISVSKFIEEAKYIGQNAIRIPDNDDLNFTGLINEMTGEKTNCNNLFSNKKQVLVYSKDNNLLIYYDEDYEDFKDLSLTKGLFFLNGNYANDEWKYIEDCKEWFKNKTEVMLDIYNLQTLKTKHMIIK